LYEVEHFFYKKFNYSIIYALIFKKLKSVGTGVIAGRFFSRSANLMVFKKPHDILKIV